MKKTEQVLSQESWTFKNKNIQLSITKQGGHLAPVYYFNDSAEPIQPYYINPWTEESEEISDPLLRVLRGNFFCLPFGAESEKDAVKYLTHGETASLEWNFISEKTNDLTKEISLEMETTAPKGKIQKNIYIIEDQNILYTKHILKGYKGKFPIGYHATLDLPEEEGSMLFSKDSRSISFTPPKTDLFDGNEYSSFLPDQTIKDLKKIPTIWKNPSETDGTVYPQRKGYSDFIQVCDPPDNLPSWTIAVFPSRGYLWFSLKNPKILPSTLLWISNGGRKTYPWNGRNRCLGLEDICGNFALGVEKSSKDNVFSTNQIPTVLNIENLDENSLNYIEGVCRIPSDFGHVEKINFLDGKLEIISQIKKKVTIDVHWDFLMSGELSNIL